MAERWERTQQSPGRAEAEDGTRAASGLAGRLGNDQVSSRPPAPSGRLGFVCLAQSPPTSAPGRRAVHPALVSLQELYTERQRVEKWVQGCAVGWRVTSAPGGWGGGGRKRQGDPGFSPSSAPAGL